MVFVLGLVATAVLTVMTQVSMLVSRADWAISGFRDYYSSDQLSYFAIVINGSQGRFAEVEPFTETGVINYPHLYYRLLGAIAHVTGVSPSATWTVVGICLVVALTVAVSATVALITRNHWLAFTGPAVLMLGTFSTFISGQWSTTLDSHAVLWGGFAVLFTLNGEAAALCIASLALLSLVVVAVRFPHIRTWMIVGTISAILIGILGNVQTYAFLTTVYVLSYAAAAYALSRTPKGWLITVSLALVPTLFFVGPVIAPALGQLATLALGLIPAVPGLVLLLIKTRGLVVVPALALALAAAPQIVGTFLSLQQGDPFLSYRVASSKNLGVPLYLGVLCAVAVLAMLVFIAVVGFRRRDVLLRSYPIAIVVVWFVVAGNDVWGANQEPYRFWIAMFLLAAVTAFPLFLYSVTLVLTFGQIPASAKAVRATAVAVPVLLLALSITDWAGFYESANKNTTMMQFTSDRQGAVSAAVAPADSSVLTDPCLDPLHFKANTGHPVVYYNAGMAWPSDRDTTQNLLQRRAEGVLASPTELIDADVSWVITDDSCAVDWEASGAGYLEPVNQGSYRENGKTVTFTLWKLDAR